MKIVLTIVGMDKVGIIAKVSNALADMNINIININQNIMQGFFNMVLIAETSEESAPLAERSRKPSSVRAVGRCIYSPYSSISSTFVFILVRALCKYTFTCVSVSPMAMAIS